MWYVAGIGGLIVLWVLVLWLRREKEVIRYVSVSVLIYVQIGNYDADIWDFSRWNETNLVGHTLIIGPVSKTFLPQVYQKMLEENPQGFMNIINNVDIVGTNKRRFYLVGYSEN